MSMAISFLVYLKAFLDKVLTCCNDAYMGFNSTKDDSVKTTGICLHIVQLIRHVWDQHGELGLLDDGQLVQQWQNLGNRPTQTLKIRQNFFGQHWGNNN